MFTAVAILANATARIAQVMTVSGPSPDCPRPSVWPWSFAAAAVCYTNYFGPVVVALVGVAALWHTRHVAGARATWLRSFALAAILYLPWCVPFVRQVMAFPEASRSWFAYAATAGQTILGLLAGNLASPSAWWVWAPLGVFGILSLFMLVQQWRAVWIPALVTLGCFAAGTLTLSMKDKYILTFSGPACIMIAATIRSGLRASRPGWLRPASCVAIVSLAAGWAGCFVNMVTERHWSSLRWLDPMEDAVGHARQAAIPTGLLVMTHPGALYYMGCIDVRESTGGGRVDPERWRATVMPHGSDRVRYGTADAREALSNFSAPPQRVVTIETAEYADDPGWRAVDEILHASYRLDHEQPYLHDPQAALKDRVDPRFVHPPWRIVVRQWTRRTASVGQ